MYKLKVGIPVADYNLQGGGGFSYPTQLISAIDNYNFNDQIEIVFIDLTGKKKNIFKKSFLSFHPFKPYSLIDFFRKLGIEILKKIRILQTLLIIAEANHSKKRNQNIKKILVSNEVKILFNITPGGNDYNFPFITVHWDIGHLSTYMFPEFLDDFETRTNYYSNILPKALMVITETEAGKKELLKCTNIINERIEVMPIFPGEVINEDISLEEQQETLRILDLKSKNYFLYPAQFWDHKNHTLLIDAFEIILLKHPSVELVFTGSDKGNLSYIKTYITKRNLDNNIKILGFVSNAELFCLYKNTISLVMPTFLGPSNMPPLEAAFLGCPVLISNLNGHHELLEDYASYFDPLNREQLAEQMLVYLDQGNKERVFSNASKFNINQALLKLEKILIKTALIRKNWE